jgi:hypothetical protein
MCCKLPAAPPPLDKPAGIWCQHCDKGKGCRIYAARPQGCQDFYCLWKVMPDFPEALRPDRCKVIWTMTEDGRTAIATTEYPKALKAKAQERLARQFARAGVSVVLNHRAGQTAGDSRAPGKSRNAVARSLAAQGPSRSAPPGAVHQSEGQSGFCGLAIRP